MANNESLRLLDHELTRCPRCGTRHLFRLVVRVTPLEETVPLFGGGTRREVALTCPATGVLVTEQVADPPGGIILGPAEPEQEASLPPFEPGRDNQGGAASPSPVKLEFADWIKSSRATALDFCKLMLTTATGSIPIYFSVLKYLGFEKAGAAAATRFGVLPPLLFLAAAVLFVLGLKPSFADIAGTDFAAFRARRLRLLNRYLTAGTAVFALGVALAIFLFFGVLVRGQG